MYDFDWFILGGLIVETNFLVFGVKLESFYSYVGKKVKSNNFLYEQGKYIGSEYHKS